ncbi:MAG TPA: methyltransferase domain-containing protein [Opitutaceae bacterium]|nr:methyltransferase domain-containing protein [Opitutaceae bacterium]
MEAVYARLPARDLPWDVARPPAILVRLVEGGRIPPGRAVDFGCGGGNHSIYLARRGFDVTGVDISRTAIALARRRARRQGVRCRFLAADVAGDLTRLPGTFAFAFDWELLHHLFPTQRGRYVRNVWAKLAPGGHYLSLCFSEEDPQFGGRGKYRTTSIGTVLYFSSRKELRDLFAPGFRILALRAVEVEGKRGAHRALCALLQRKRRWGGGRPAA